MDLELKAVTRGLFSENISEGVSNELSTNNRSDLIVAQGLPELTELVRLGQSWQLCTTTGLAAATALPTTTSGLSLNNNEPSNGKCYAVDAFGSIEEVIDATQTDVTALLAMLNKRTSTQAAVGSGAAETAIRSLSARPNYDGSATLFRAATVTNDSWTGHGTPGAQMAAVAGGANWKINEALVRGIYLIPPGGSFSIAAVKAGAASAAQQFYFIRWHEVQLIWRT